MNGTIFHDSVVHKDKILVFEGAIIENPVPNIVFEGYAFIVILLTVRLPVRVEIGARSTA